MTRAGQSSDVVFSQAYQTKMEIAKTMNRLCETIPFSKLKVDQIVQEADISRSGFYYHFEDKNDVVAWLTEQFYKAGVNETGRTLTWFEGHLLTTRRFLQFAALLTSAESSSDYDSAVPMYIRNRERSLRETLTDYQHVEITPLLDFQVRATTRLETNMTSLFRKGKLGNITTKEFCNYIISCIPRELYEALDPPAQPRNVDIGTFYFE